MKAKLPEHLHVFEGQLFDTRAGTHEPVRSTYCAQFARINSLSEVKATIRAGEFTFPGCYQLFFITSDGASLCFACARKEFRQVVWDYLNDCSTGWRIDACDVNYEDSELTCAHCNKQIPASYGE